MDDELQALGKAVLAAQPFSVFMGVELLDFAQGRVEMALPLRPEFGQQFGFIHGGVISFLADNA
ncbi:MAG TPA: PaaI family thioesterase, partial [Ktedonobacterales bacterium]|nr:PaaI family thioesterase [Ktedonobacterales bacterium]